MIYSRELNESVDFLLFITTPSEGNHPSGAIRAGTVFVEELIMIHAGTTGIAISFRTCAVTLVWNHNC